MKLLIAAFLSTAIGCGGSPFSKRNPSESTGSGPDVAHPPPTRVAMGLAYDRSHAGRIVAQLKQGGFANQQISALLFDRASSRDFAREEQINVPPAVARSRALTGGPATLPVTAHGDTNLTGASESTAGAVETVVAAISKAAAGGGDIRRSLTDMGAPEATLTKYEQSIRDGSILVWVHCEDDAQRSRAKTNLEAAGGTNVALSTITLPTNSAQTH